jgi:hypothetical protein
MNTFQTLLALVVLIFVLSVVVQALQEILKSVLNTKATTMENTIDQFMGTYLPLADVKKALQIRGLDITALEHFNRDGFRQLLDGIDFTSKPPQGIVLGANVTLDQTKDNIAAAYDAARASFQKSYTTKNKKWVLGLSFVVVLILNANLIMLYQDLSADQVMAQAIVGKADKATCSQGKEDQTQQEQPGNQSLQRQQLQTTELGSVYKANRDCIKTTLKNFPILMRSSRKQYGADWQDSNVDTILGLILMGILVSLGAPFWNDALKGMMGVNNALNTNNKEGS